MRILWLYGPPAAGKSVVAWALLNQAARTDPRIGYLDIDQLGMTHYRHDDVDPGRHDLKAHGLAAVAREFEASGARALIVSGVVSPEVPDFYRATLGSYRPAFVRVTASDDELKRRLAARGADAEEWVHYETYVRQLEATRSEQPVIDTTTESPDRAAARCLPLLASLLSEDSKESPAAISADEAGDGSGGEQVLLLGGTTAVGKSTIGFEAYLTCQRDDRRCAFIDLRQLGLVGPHGGPVDHSLQARAAAALWRVQRAHGARLLIMNGPVNRGDELAPYSTAFGSTPLTAVRLTAERPALVERVKARFRGEMAALAGDELLGRPAADAGQIVDSALRVQAEADADGSIPTLDTTSLAVAEAARRVLHALPTGPAR